MKKLTPLCFLLFFGWSHLGAQDLEIRYDVVFDTLGYFYKGKKIDRPKVRKNANIRLKIINYNDYIVQAQVVPENLSYDIAPISGGGITSLLNFSNDALGSMGGLMPMPITNENYSIPIPGGGSSATGGSTDNHGTNTGKSDEEDEFGFGTSTTASSLSVNKRAEITSAINSLNRLEDQLVSSNAKILDNMNSLSLIQVTEKQIKQMLQNPAIPVESIKRISKELIEMTFQLDEGESLDPKKAISFSNTFQGQVRIDLVNLMQAQDEYLEHVVGLDALTNGVISSLNISNTADLALKKSIENTMGKARTQALLTEENVKRSEALMTMISTGDFQSSITNLYLKYVELEEHPFEYNFMTQGQDDEMDLKIQLFQKDSTGEVKVGALPIKERKINVAVAGGIKINASVGLGFSQYFKTPQLYFVQQDTIRSEDGDQFLPMVTTMLHFYPQTIGSVSAGGAFGVGFPITGENKSLAFFLGPTLIFGKQQRIILSGGMMGGQVKRLSKGFKAGDYFPDSGGDIPTKNAYDLGYFLSITFNLNSL